MALLSLFFALPTALYAQLNVESGTIDVDLIVEGCNNNSVCETGLGEDIVTCPLDCPALPPTPVVTPVVDSDAPRAANRRFVKTETGTVEEVRTGTGDISVEQFVVTPRVVSATFTFSTNTNTIASVRVGETSDYELRAVAEFGYRKTHELMVSGLQPGTTYQYEVIMLDLRGAVTRVRGAFTTQSALSIPSVSQSLLAKPFDIKVRIVDGVATATWSNPIQQSFSYTSVVRTTDAPAKTPGDGIVVYRGNDTTFVDTGIVPDGTYYYTFFANHGKENFADGAFVTSPYSNDAEATQTFTEFEPQFGDDDLSVFDFSFTQSGESLDWEDKVLQASPFEPIMLQFQKPNFFGPLEDVYVDVIAYDVSGVAVDRRFQKLAFRTELHAYQTTLAGFEPDYTLLVTLKVVRADGTFERLLTKIKVGTYSTFEASGSATGVSCRGNAVGVEHIKNVLMCTMPWPLILLTALLAVLMYVVRKILIK